jgi:hypothetical protein
MPLELTASQIQALAPDAASVAAGRKLGKPGSWKNLGHSAEALWGECQGSALYQTRVALVDLAAQCSCPSRKFPCKHALGLMFLAVDTPAVFAETDAPEWVASWLTKRGAAAEKKKARVEQATAKPVDPVAHAKRAEKRHENVLAGLDQLDAWCADLVRQGIARAQAEPPSFWDLQARRLIDAQAPGLAARVRQLGVRVGERSDWAVRLLDDLGSLALLSHAYRRIGELKPALSADVRRIVGLTLEQADVVAHGDLVEDHWVVLADSLEEEERVRVQRAWLRGETSGRTALVLQFAAYGARFAEALVAGTRVRARLAFWPSAAPERALIVARLAPAEPFTQVPAGDDVARALDGFAARLARLPWVERALLVLGSVVPVHHDRVSAPAEPTPPVRSELDLVVDGVGQALPLVRGEHDVLFALSGGHPITLAGEWDGYALVPYTAWAEGRMVALPPRSA